MLDPIIWQLPGARKAFGIACLMACLQTVCIVMCAYTLATALYHLWCTQIIADQGGLLALFALSFLAISLVRSATDRYFFHFATGACQQLRRALLEKTFSQGLSLVSACGSATLTTLALDDLDAIHGYARHLLPRAANAVVVTCGVMIALWCIDWVSGLIATLMIPVTALFMALLGNMAQKAATSQRGVYEQHANAFADALRGLDTLKRLGVSKAWEKTITASSEAFRQATMKVLRVATLSGSVLDLISTLALAAVAVMLGFRLVDGTVGLHAALIVLILVPDCFKPVRAFASDFHSSLDGKNALVCLLTVLNTNNAKEEQVPTSYNTKTEQTLTSNKEGAEIKAGQAPVSLVHSDSATFGIPASCSTTAPVIGLSPGPTPRTPQPHCDPSQLTVTLTNVSFRYQAHAPFVLDSVSATFRAPATVGVVGPSGVGKSTLLSLVSGFLTPTSGQISLEENGHSLTPDQWRKEILYLPQKPFIFHGTLRDNLIFYTPKATDEAILEALDKVGLSALLQKLTNGLDTIIGEAGRQLSGGEAHRVALCRALLDPSRRVLIFDEPTAHLDIETEIALKEPMLELMKSRLVFFGTHRLHWLNSFDEVVHLKGGSLQINANTTPSQTPPKEA